MARPRASSGEPGLRFKVWPGRSRRDYFFVYLYPTRARMHAAHRREYGRKAIRSPKLQAVASCGPPLIGPRRSACRGNIRFHVGAITAGIVSHEMVHAALYWLWHEVRMRVHPQDKRRITGEEVLASTVQTLVTQFWGSIGRLQEKRMLRKAF